jgi:hypothetical protein
MNRRVPGPWSRCAFVQGGSGSGSGRGEPSAGPSTKRLNFSVSLDFVSGAVVALRGAVLNLLGVVSVV